MNGRYREDRALAPWREAGRKTRLETRVFRVVERQMQEVPDRGEGRRGTFYNIDPPDWVNVVALTSDRQVVLIEQFRHGTDAFTLEIPGGMVDPGESPLRAARRELAEESGYAAARWEKLGIVHPNPAIQTNTTHTFLAIDAERIHEPSFDTNEACRLVLAAWTDALEAVDRGEITHALVVCALHFAARRLGSS